MLTRTYKNQSLRCYLRFSRRSILSKKISIFPRTQIKLDEEMEKTMFRTSCLSVALLTIVLLMGTSSSSARTEMMVSSTPAGPVLQFIADGSAVPSFQIATIWASAVYSGDSGGNRYGRGDGGQKGYGEGGNDGGKGDNDGGKGGHDGGKDGHDDGGHAPSPAPEPSTILSFGVALLVGGGVLLSRRLLGSRK
jgi:hypothetical protein